MMVQSSRRFWNRDEVKIWRTSCGVNLCLARRHRVARPNFVGVEKGFFENTLLWVEELTNEGIVESGLPLLNESHFKATVVRPVCIDWDWSPNVQVVMILPIAKCQLCLKESLIGELKVFS